MPRKIRQLRSELQREGFSLDTRRGKGSHTYWSHPLVPYPVVISGQNGDDVDRYQERDVRDALHDLREARKRGKP